jgi:hypothetical protein
MVYCTPADVRLIIDTDLSDDELTSLIVFSDSDLDDLLQGASMTDTQKKKCSMRLCAIAVAGRQPVKESTGDLSLDYSGQTAEWQAYVDRYVSLALASGQKKGKVTASTYSEINED